ncbi:EAL domain-containing protein [Sulfurimonas sp. NWX79]|uniref:bifunctional diguanylate cyclase/phosphodiesterase n=1 Tax=Sulfurimonas sp. NWX79 TaxID=2925412 RepID=UPI003204A0BD
MLDQMLLLNPTLTGVGLFKPDGTPYLATSNIDVKKIPNLLQTKKTREGFLDALESDRMVVGRTYYLEALKSLVIPIRKALYDKKGDVVAVIASGISLSKKNQFIHSLLGANKIFILRDKDNYLQFYDFEEYLYRKPVGKRALADIFQIMEQVYAKPLRELKNSEAVISVTCTSYITGKLSYSSYKYIKRYKEWIVVTTPLTIIRAEYLNQELILLAIYILILFIIYYLIGVIDRNEMQKQRTLKEQAIRDSLTSLYNRYYIEEKIKNFKSKYTLFFIDLDGFKSINDSFGHEYGDKVLQIIAARLMSLAKKEEHRDIIRYSGDEFILITEFMSDDSIGVCAKGILHAISGEFVIDEFKFVLGASIGVARYPYDGKNFDEVKRYADLAMYKAKEMKNSFVIFHEAIKEKYLRSAMMERELKMALSRGEISMVYQPQVYIDGKIYGVEALVRWNNETLGFVPPDEFIAIAEITGLIKDIGRFIISKVLEDVYEIQQAAKKEFHLSINISAKQFSQHDFLSCIIGKVTASQIKTELISLEITETVFIEDKKHVIAILEDIKKQGMKISLDDFGTGYSSMNILRNLPIDELKIDKSFIDDIVEEKDTRQIVHSIIIIAKSLGLQVVAEGVENMEQKEILESFGCDIYQGYLFAKPMKKEELVEKLIKNKGIFDSVKNFL